MAEAGERQEILDQLYLSRGACCAGCDWWRSLSVLVGECTRSAYVSGAERLAALGITSCSMLTPAGHAVTTRDHVCGEFKDTFDWSTLPLAYQRRIGLPATTQRPEPVSQRSPPPPASPARMRE